MADPYSEFQNSAPYQAKHSGAGIEVVVLEEGNPNEEDGIVGAVTSINWNDSFEQIRDEQVGHLGATEVFEGIHSGNLSLAGFFIPAQNDRLPTYDTFVGKTYTVIERVGEGRAGEGTVINAAIGCKISQYGSNHAARGPKTINVTMEYVKRYNGEQWAKLTGTFS
jgi:hypothetical protein